MRLITIQNLSGTDLKGDEAPVWNGTPFPIAKGDILTVDEHVGRHLATHSGGKVVIAKQADGSEVLVTNEVQFDGSGFWDNEETDNPHIWRPWHPPRPKVEKPEKPEK